jgi:hypothetical protein
VRGETVEVSAPEPGGQAGGEALFQTASSDGSKVFFTDYARLTGNSTALSNGSVTAPDLYVFEVTSGKGEPLAGKLTDLSVDPNYATDGEHATVQGDVLGASEDGSYVYFVANGVLGDAGEHGASPGNCVHGGTCNLYVEHFDGGGWEAPEFIATLSSEDAHDWAGEPPPGLPGLSARVSPDGRWLAFMSDQRLTGYDNDDVNSGVPDEEVFLFDEATGKLVCASCNPTGQRPAGVFDPEPESGEPEPRPVLLVDERGVWDGHWLSGSVPGWTSNELSSAIYQSRYLSDNGRLFFDSADGLVPEDVNGKEDVYEFEPVGVGGCSEEVADASWVFVASEGGCVGLISLGTSAEESAFLDASAAGGRNGDGDEGGGDVFFLTASQLAPEDVDQAFDVYDAHECSTGWSCASAPPVAPSACSPAETCQAAEAPQPVFGVPPSATFSGTGNLVPAPPVAVVKPKPRVLSGAEKLAAALKACRKKTARRKRAGCEKRARRAYGAQAHPKGASRGGAR